MDHTAVERGRVSFRVDPVANKTIQSVEWVQANGVNDVVAAELEEQENRLFFDAPEVTQDTILKFTANVTFTGSSTTAERPSVSRGLA